MKLSHALVSILGATTLSLTGLVMTEPAFAAESCHKINAKGIGQDLGGGHTTADIKGGGLLNGTTAGTFTTDSVTGSVATISGTVVFTTHQGSLTVTVAGTFDVSTGAFTATGPVTAASGKLNGATGNLTLAGNENLSTGSFTEQISGTTCVDLKP